MRKLLFIAIATCFLTQANAAPASRESVEALLEATKSQTTMESAYPAMEQFIRQSMQQAAGATPLTPEQMRIFDAMPARVMVVMRSEFSWEKMKPEFIQLYQDIRSGGDRRAAGFLSQHSRPGIREQDANGHAEDHDPDASADAASHAENKGDDRAGGKGGQA